MDVEPEAAGSLFQTSTLDAILDGAYDGDVTFAELATSAAKQGVIEAAEGRT